MSNRDKFLKPTPTEEEAGEYLEWNAAVQCQICHEPVYDQRYYVGDSVLFWQCSKGHKSMIESFSIF